MLHRLVSFPQAQPSLHQQQQQQQQQQQSQLQQPQQQRGAPPPERAFGPRAADYPSRHIHVSSSPRLVPPCQATTGGSGLSGEHSWQHQPHPPLNAKQRPGVPRVGSARAGGGGGGCPNGGRTSPIEHPQYLQLPPGGAYDSPLGSPAPHGHGSGQGQGHGGWGAMEGGVQLSPGYLEAATAAAAAAAARADRGLSPPGSPQRPGSPSPPPPLLQPAPHYHSFGRELPQLPVPHPHTRPQSPQLPQQQQTQQLPQPSSPADRRLRPWTPRSRRPQSSGPGRHPPPQQQGQGQGQQAGEVVVVGLRDVPPSQLPYARAVVEPERAGGGGGYGGQPQLQRPCSRSSDNDTHASWWQRPPHGGAGAEGGAGDSEASYPLTAVTDRHTYGEDDMTPSEAALWLGRMAELEAEVMEEREFRRKYEEELRMLAVAATAGGRGGRPSGGGPMLWQTTGGRVLSGARAAAAAVMRHRAGMRS